MGNAIASWRERPPISVALLQSSSERGVQAAPAPSFKMSQPARRLRFLIVAFAPPSQLGNVDELTERDVFRKRRQPIFDRLLLAIGPFNQQPLLRPTVGEPVIPMRDTNAHTGKSRGQLLPRCFPPFDRAPRTLSQTPPHLFHP